MANSNTNNVVFSGSCSSPAKKNAYPYKGIRMRKWGKWVAEVREPNKRTRIWLGSYHTPIAAARAYDTATYYLRGPTAKINFPEFLRFDSEPDRLSADCIRKIATEVGARVDAEIRGVRVHEERSYVRYLFVANFDLNKEPEPEPETETEPEE